ncbi:MAG: sodium:proton antiporter [Saprospiraceae bacterium]
MVEIGSIVILGILAQWIAWRLKVPAILPLILTGLVVGPLSTLWNGGHKLIEPIWNATTQSGLFPGETLFHFVELGIGIILFEGGMTLKKDEIEDVGETIIKLITGGALITFIGGALIAHFIIELDWNIAFLFAGLIIVTGPTVIAPILRNIPLNRNVSTVLKWEGILIDPIGALVAVLVYEFIISADGGLHFTSEALQHFLVLVCVGLALGVGSAFLMRFLLKRNFVPHYLLTIFSLAYVLAVYVGSNLLTPDSGLLTVVVFGMVLGNVDVPHIKEITYFKESLSILLISILFILIAANVDIADLMLLNDWRIITSFFIIILIIRPLGVFWSTKNSSLTKKEKAFISWMGPRGIVAAGIASLLGSKLTKLDVPGAEYITPLVFMVVLGTVILNATTARLLAKMLGLLLKKSNGILILGATKASRIIAKYINENNRHVVLVDGNANNVNRAIKEGLQAIQANVYSESLADDIALNDMGYLLAMTGSDEVNRHASGKLHKYLGEEGTFIIASSDESENELYLGQSLFSEKDDFISLSEVARDYPTVQEIKPDSKDSFYITLEAITAQSKSVPLFIKDAEGNLEIMSGSRKGIKYSEGDSLVYMGKEVKWKTIEDV